MAQSTITARVDDREKAAFDSFCRDVGLNTSTAINLFVKAVLREHRIPFEISQSSDPFFSESNQRYLMKSIQELRSGKGQAHELIEADNEWKNLVWRCLEGLSVLAVAGQKTLKRINALIKDIERNGCMNGIGNPELLTGNLQGEFSRRINEKDRLVYHMEDGRIYIAQCRGHYDDK